MADTTIMNPAGGPGITTWGSNALGGRYVAGNQPANQDYYWDNVQGKYIKKPQALGNAIGTEAGSALSALNQAFPGATNPSTGNFGGSSYPTLTLPTLGGPGGGGGAGSPQVQFNAADFSKAQDAAWNRAKDLTGKTSAAAVTGLRSSLGGRGLLGSGIEGKQTAGVMNAGQQQLGDVSRQQAIDSATQAQKNAETQYQGGITQRGQDLDSQRAANALAAQLAEAQYNGQIQMRGQDMQARLAQMGYSQSLIDKILGALQGYGAY